MKSGRQQFVILIFATACWGLVAGDATAGGPVILRGVVVDPEGNPLAGATVSVTANDGAVERTTRSNKKGKFGFRVPDFELVYTLTVELEGFSAALSEVRPEPENPPPLTVTLVPADRVSATEAPAAPQAESAPGEAPPEISEARAAAIPVFNEGVAALEAEDASGALAKFKQAAEIDPDFAAAFNAVAVIAEELEDFATVADAAERLVELEPDNLGAIARAYFSEVMILDVERLIPAARRLVEVRPEVATDQMAQHARVLFDEDEFGVSRELLLIIVDTAPDFAPAYLQLGLTCNMLQDAECATAALQKFLELAPDDPEAATAQSLLDYLK